MRGRKVRVRIVPISADEIRARLAAIGEEPEFETAEWHEWSQLKGALRLATRGRK